jgi:hypothetical protein
MPVLNGEDTQEKPGRRSKWLVTPGDLLDKHAVAGPER